MFSGVAELLAAAARPGGLTVVIEDVHWADGATLDFLTFLTRAGRAEAVRVVATVRSDEAPAEPAVSRWLAYARGSGHAHEIRLGPLSRDEMAEQVTGLTGGQLRRQAWPGLYARGEGNPFFTEQLVAGALAGDGTGTPAGPRAAAPRLAELLAAAGERRQPAGRGAAGRPVGGRAAAAPTEQLAAVTRCSAPTRCARAPGAGRPVAGGDRGGRAAPGPAPHALLAEAASAARRRPGDALAGGHAPSGRGGRPRWPAGRDA